MITRIIGRLHRLSFCMIVLIALVFSSVCFAQDEAAQQAEPMSEDEVQKKYGELYEKYKSLEQDRDNLVHQAKELLKFKREHAAEWDRKKAGVAAEPAAQAVGDEAHKELQKKYDRLLEQHEALKRQRVEAPEGGAAVAAAGPEYEELMERGIIDGYYQYG